MSVLPEVLDTTHVCCGLSWGRVALKLETPRKTRDPLSHDVCEC